MKIYKDKIRIKRWALRLRFGQQIQGMQKPWWKRRQVEVSLKT